ncbi:MULTISPECIES: hypothetical protein [Methanosarcina]
MEAVLGIKQYNASRHLNKLKMAGINLWKNTSGSIIDPRISFF